MKLFWTVMFGFKAAVLFTIAVIAITYGESSTWPIPAVYVLTGVVAFLIGVLMDVRDDYNRPQLIEVLLRHKGEAFLLTVLRTRKGELFAPADSNLRKLKSVDVKELPETILGCPKFEHFFSGNATVFRVLGRIYG